MAWIFSFLTLVGLNFGIWTIIGFIRFLTSAPKKYFISSENIQNKILPRQVAAIIPAHNEELTIGKTIKSLKKILPAKNIYVGSDASTDATVKIVKKLGANVLDIFPNKGKAGVLAYLIKYFNLTKKYKAIIIIDADTQIGKKYLKKALPLFNDGKVVAIAAHACSKWNPHLKPQMAFFYSAYRIRLYRILQSVMRYGQTWKYTNVTSIVPGFSSIYRSEVLEKIKIDAPGLIIEDYNMTFEIHHKNLGKIDYSPQVYSFTQDPLSLKDYINQIKRWNLGFWQTVRHHGVWFSFFWLALAVIILEMLFYSFFLLTLPLWLLILSFNCFHPLVFPFSFDFFNFFTISQLSLMDIFIGVWLTDYIITFWVAFYERKPILLFYGIGFPLLRYIDAFWFLYTLPLAFITKSDGRWKSPKRK